MPEAVLEVLRWHVDTQLVTPEQRASELLFPAADGGLLTEHSLRKPFARIRGLIGLDMRFAPRGMRRTFNDLARAAQWSRSSRAASPATSRTGCASTIRRSRLSSSAKASGACFVW